MAFINKQDTDGTKANLLKGELGHDDYTATEYQRLRKAEYDKLNQDEMRFDDTVNSTTILAIKAKYPKGE